MSKDETLSCIDVSWHLTDCRSEHYEYPLDDRARADYACCTGEGRIAAAGP